MSKIHEQEPRYYWMEGFDAAVQKVVLSRPRYEYPTKRDAAVNGTVPRLIPFTVADLGIYYCDLEYDFEDTGLCLDSIYILMGRYGIDSFIGAELFCNGASAGFLASQDI